MRRAGSVIESLSPWAGLVIGLAALAFVHQFGSDGTFDSCSTHAPVPVLVVGVLGLLACLVAGIVSWRSLAGEDGTARRVVAVVSVGCTALFSLTIIFPMIAALVLPPCFG